MATSNSHFLKEQEQRCRRLAAGCTAKAVADDLLRLAEHYAAAAAGKAEEPRAPQP